MAVLMLASAAALIAGDVGAKRTKSQPAAATAADKRSSTELCDGGMLVTNDDQIRGCTALITGGRLSRERKATAYYNRGNAYVGKNDFARAIADYDQALALNGQYTEAYFNRAVAKRATGDFLGAVLDYTSALNLAPKDADAFAGRGMAFARLNRKDKALEDFNKAIGLKPDHSAALTQRGHIHMREQNWPSAIADYDAALSISAANVEALYGRGVAKIYSEDIKGGQVDMTAALMIDSGVTGRMTTLGIPPPVFSAPEQEPIERAQPSRLPSPNDKPAGF